MNAGLTPFTQPQAEQLVALLCITENDMPMDTEPIPDSEE